MHVSAMILNIDTAPEFGEITGDEATITVVYTHPVWANAPAVTKTIGVTKAEAEAYRVGQRIPLLHH